MHGGRVDMAAKARPLPNRSLPLTSFRTEYYGNCIFLGIQRFGAFQPLLPKNLRSLSARVQVPRKLDEVSRPAHNLAAAKAAPAELRPPSDSVAAPDLLILLHCLQWRVRPPPRASMYLQTV